MGLIVYSRDRDRGYRIWDELPTAHEPPPPVDRRLARGRRPLARRAGGRLHRPGRGLRVRGLAAGADRHVRARVRDHPDLAASRLALPPGSAVGNPYKHAQAKRVVILGLDGHRIPASRPSSCAKGACRTSRSSPSAACSGRSTRAYPSMSPVAWSTLRDRRRRDAGHGIYDFLTRDPCTYAPMLSSTDDRARRSASLNIGPLRRCRSASRRSSCCQKSQQFWKLLGDKQHLLDHPARADHVPARAVQERAPALGHVRARPARQPGHVLVLLAPRTRDGKAAFIGGEQTVLRRGKDGAHPLAHRRARPRAAARGRAHDAAVHARARRRRARARLEIDGGRRALDLALGEY